MALTHHLFYDLMINLANELKLQKIEEISSFSEELIGNRETHFEFLFHTAKQNSIHPIESTW